MSSHHSKQFNDWTVDELRDHDYYKIYASGYCYLLSRTQLLRDYPNAFANTLIKPKGEISERRMDVECHVYVFQLIVNHLYGVGQSVNNILVFS